MNDFSALIVGQHLTRKSSHSALPEAPLQPAKHEKTSEGSMATLRRKLSSELRHLADRLEPVSRGQASPTHLQPHR
jgi:hypothetical protein